MSLGLRRTVAALAAVAGPLIMTAPAGAEPAVGVLEGSGNALVTFDTSAPGEFTSIRTITGLQPNEAIVGIDYRHVPPPPLDVGATPPGLFGLGIVDAGATDTARLYRIDEGTGAATIVGTPITSLDDGAEYGADFNPTSDRLRVVSDADENLRINPNTGLRVDGGGGDTNLNPAGVDIEAVAFNRVDSDASTATNQLALDSSPSNLHVVQIGGVDGMPSPNFGAVTDIGNTGVNTSPAWARNLDISPTGTAYATVTTDPVMFPNVLSPNVYTVNVSTGAFTLVGPLSSGLRGFAVIPGSSMQFDAAAAQVTEGETATLTVSRSGSPSGTSTVDYRAEAGTTAGSEFEPAAGSLTFASGETQKTIAVVTGEDVFDEPDETIVISLTGPNAPTTLGTPSALTLTVADDDVPPVVFPPVDDPPDEPSAACTKAEAKLKAAKKKLKKLKADDSADQKIEKAKQKVKKQKQKVKRACA